MNAFDMKKKELLALDLFMPEEKFNGIIIVNTGHKHESGFMSMRFVLVRGCEIVGCVGDYSDTIELNGIGGYGLNWSYAFNTGKTDRIPWVIDMLPNGCCRLFVRSGFLSLSKFIGSSFEIFYNKEQMIYGYTSIT